MGQKMMIIGDSGSGKSTSTRNLDEKSTFYINVIGKPLPFKGWKAKYKALDEQKKGNLYATHKADAIVSVIKWVDKNRPEIKTIIIDDAQYIMSFEFMERAKEKGFDKFVEIGRHMFDVLTAPDDTRDDLTTVFLSHSEDVSANGFQKTKMKTIGKMLDDKITVEGLFTIVFVAYAQKKDKVMEYVFVTQSNGTTTAKSPMGMFEELTIPNDLKDVLKVVKEYNEG